MKAERRHELKTNTLAQGIEGLPVFWRQHGTKLLLGVVAVLAIILFVRFQRNAARQERELAAESYANALAAIDNVRDPRLSADQRRDIQQSAMAALQQVLDGSNDEVLRANALLAQGDLHWHLAHVIELPAGATTQAAQTRPANRNEDDAELLERAQKAYEAVLQAPGAKPATLTSARLGLAAIAEEQGTWDEAAKHYDEILNNAAMPETFKAEARLRKADLDDLRQPALIGGPPTRPSEEPTTAPLGPIGPAAPVITPTTAPTTRPTTQTQPAAGEAVER